MSRPFPARSSILDRNLNITSANRAFYQTFRTSPDETEGCLIYDLGNRQWDIPALRTLLESVIPHRASVEGFEVEHDFPTIGRRTMLVNARKIFRPGEHDGFILLAIEDVSEERAARKESNRNWQLTQSIVDTIRDPLVVLENDMTIVTASKAFLTMFGITQAEAHGRRVSELGQHQWDVPALRNLMEKVLPENKPIESFEIEDDFPGLGRRVFNLNARKIIAAGQSRPPHAAGVRGHHRPQAARARCRTAHERDFAPHQEQSADRRRADRLRNQIDAAPPAFQGYKAMQARIGAIAQLYDLISQSSRGGSIAVDAYLQRNRQADVGEPDWRQVGHRNTRSRPTPLEIDPDRAVPFGLLVNELATNAIKHAFPNGARPCAAGGGTGRRRDRAGGRR